MKIDERYAIGDFDKRLINYNLLLTFFLFVFVIIFFNDVPSTDFEIFLDSFLIKDRGVYSQIYPFQSQIISNLTMILSPISALICALTFKFHYVSEREIIELGMSIEKKALKRIIIKIFGILSLLTIISICMFSIYIDYAPLDEVAIKTSFVRDSFVTVICLPYLFYSLSMVLIMFLINIVHHPIIYFKYLYYYPESRKYKMRLLIKNREKIEINNKQ